MALYSCTRLAPHGCGPRRLPHWRSRRPRPAGSHPGRLAEVAQALLGKIAQWCARKPRSRGRWRRERGARNGRVGNDQRAQPTVEGDARDRVDVRDSRSGATFKKTGGPGATRFDNGIEQSGKRAFVLQDPQSGRVGAGDIHREIGGERCHHGHGDIVGDSIFAVLVGADVDAHDPRPTGAAHEPVARYFRTAIVDPSG